MFDKLYIESVVCALLQTYGLLGKSEKAGEKGRKKGQTKSGNVKEIEATVAAIREEQAGKDYIIDTIYL